MIVRPVERGDAADWERMRETLWPSSPHEQAGEIERYFSGDRRIAAEVLLALDPDGRAIGFAELSIRPYAEGCAPGRVAYLEGWFVEESLRRRGVGAALVAAAETWARERGCAEFASDADPGNAASLAAHRALGFEEAGRVVCFRKSLR